MSEPWRLPTLEGLEWKSRNSAVEVALRLYLAQLPRGTILTTGDLAKAIAAPDEANRVQSVLLKLSKWMGASLATHDGPAFMFKGKPCRRWQWHGLR